MMHSIHCLFRCVSHIHSSPFLTSMASSIISFVLFFIFFLFIHEVDSQVEFIFNGFNGTNEKNLSLDNASIVKPSGALRLTNRSLNSIGHGFYSNRIMFNKTSPNAFSFNTSFVFSIVPPSSGKGGFGLAFALAPSYPIQGAAAEHYLGLFNASNNGQSSNHIFAVEFDTVSGFGDNLDRNGNHVAININSVESNISNPASYTTAKNELKQEDLDLHSGEPIQAWIEYDGFNKIVNVTICPMGLNKPSKPLITYPVDLTPIILETMYVGFSASTGKQASSHYILGWSFSTKGEAPALNLSQLPVPPVEKDSSSFPGPVVALIIALCAVIVVSLGILLCLILYKRIGRFERLEDWELDCPHRFQYRDLYAATKGFKQTEIIGVGGFGTVYKAVLPSTGNEVAVKKITRNSIQGLKEFAAEIESLGRLRHKHLVNLQGWCKKKNDLLVVYDYIPNGSLDTLLFHPKNNIVLSWEQRFNIIKGIAAGLLYLHEEWEQVVIHRDVKSSNVLIDSEMNGRLGDFGLARLYDHGIDSHTTNVVGTIGYIAPELARTGKVSTSSDVFAYGVLLLEVATGRRPIESGQFILVDWVMEHKLMGRILEVVDPKLNSDYAVEEMELVLELGLVCSHQKALSRPSMRQVARYLNGDEKIPVIEDWGSFDSQSVCEIHSRLLNVSYEDTSSTSYHSSSVTYMSKNSIDAGR